MRTIRTACGLALTLTAVLTACSSGSGTAQHSSPAPPSRTRVPPTTAPVASAAPTTSPTTAPSETRWQHVVIVVEENRNSTSIIGSPDAPYLKRLAAQGLNFTDMHAETHPSQPNYIALLSGSTQGLTDDSCPHTFPADNLGHQLRAAGYSFTGYSESLPHAGYTGCTDYPYARRHVPWTDFSDLPATVNQPLSAFPSDYTDLPSVSFVIPNVLDDMHDGTVAEADTWLRSHLSAYAAWARTHHSLLLVTWDEDEGSQDNHIATMAVGQGIAPGKWAARADHYTLLRAIEDAYRLPLLGKAAAATPLPPIR